MLAYSARKNSAKRMPLYSVWNPPVSSCSASGRSNGARLVSARPPMKKMTNATGCTKTNQTPLVVLRLDDADHAERAGDHDDADERHRDRDLVADQLRRRAQAGEQRELAVRRVAREDDAVDADRRDRHDVEQADVDVGDDERHRGGRRASTSRPERDDRERRSAPAPSRRSAPAVNTHLSARAGVMSSLSISLMASAIGCSDAVRPDPHRAEPRPAPTRSPSARAAPCR